MKEAESVKVPGRPSPPQLRSWKVAVRDEVASASGNPEAGFQWIAAVDAPGASLEALALIGEFPTLVATLSKIAAGDLGRQLTTIKEQHFKRGNYLKGRQIINISDCTRWKVHCIR